MRNETHTRRICYLWNKIKESLYNIFYRNLMKKLVLSSEWKFHKVYQSWLNKYRVRKELVTLVEIIMLLIAILFCLLIFLIYINKSSTQWYFLRSARNTYNNTVFNHEIIKTDILDLKKINRDKLKENNSKTSLWTNVETININ